MGFEITDSPFNKQDSFVRAHGANGAGGSAIGINQDRIGTQENVRADRLSNGNTVAVWESKQYVTSSGHGLSEIRARILGADGKPVTRDIIIADSASRPNSKTELTEPDVSVAALSGGRFVAVWTESGGAVFHLYAPIFDSTGNPQGDVIQVKYLGQQIDSRSPQCHGTGWRRLRGGLGPDFPGDQEDVYAQTFSEYGIRVGGNFRVNQETADSQDWASVTGLKDGGFLVAYESEYLDGAYEALMGRVHSGLTREQASLGGRPVASSRADVLNGTAKGDAMNGLDGNDTLRGGCGNEVVVGAR